jgi:1-acyl-sn-glycerol-3-phosphate acyltransferase
MKFFPRIAYETLKLLTKIYLHTILEFKLWGSDHIPPGPKIFCSNHFSSTDPFFVITLMNDSVHMIIGPGFSVPIARTILKLCEQINALPENRRNVVQEAISYLKKGESIYIFPEGDLNDQNTFLKFYNGLARIYMEYPVPIVPIGIVSPKRYVKETETNIKVGEIVYKTLTVLAGKYFANIGKPLYFDPEKLSSNYDLAVESITSDVKKEIENLVYDIKINKFWS